MIYQQLPDLPLDIIKDILTRLPVKTLIKFKCVSKLFLSLISNEKFIDTHLKKACKNPYSARVILCSDQPRVALKSYSLHSVHDSHPYNAQELEYPLKDTGFSVLLVGSINGLVCIAIEYDLFIWNPSTRVSKKLPKMGLERCETLTTFGFGYDERNEDYKVVRIFSLLGDLNSRNTIVYSSRVGSWKTITEFPSELTITNIPGTFLNGSLHWLVHKFSEFTWVIVSFDLLNETYSEIEVPNFGYACYPTLGALQGYLCLLVDFMPVRSDLWAMKKYGVRDSWVKLYAIPYLFQPCEGTWYSFPLSISSSGELFMKIGNSFILYNPSEETFRVPRVPKLQSGFVIGVTYVESLVTPILCDY